MNLLTEPTISLPGAGRATLAATLCAMAEGKVAAFPALRPHQRPAWHMFLVQLAALALSKAGASDVVHDEASWRGVLRGLTPGYPEDEPWRLVVESRESPAFMQPPDPGGLKWTKRFTPDHIDMLITARNHDLKQAVAVDAETEDWLYALVSLQTCEGYGGRGNQGIARMNGGFASRPMFGLVPATGRDQGIHASQHWLRDVRALLASRKRGEVGALGTPGGHSLLWVMPWPERSRLELDTLDPWFVEVCRRVKLVSDEGKLFAECANTTDPRTNAKAFHGNVGDPWTPVEVKDGKSGKSLKISRRGFNYKQMCDLLYSGEWQLPLLAYPSPGESGDMLLLAEAICRGKSKTEGFKSRTIPVPARRLRMFASDEVGRLAEAQTKEIAAFDKALRDGLALAAAGGPRQRAAIKKGHYGFTNNARARFDRAADAIFFPRLWSRTAAARDPQAADQAKHAFLAELKAIADRVFKDALPQMPCPAIHRNRAEARARSLYEATLRREEASRALSKDIGGHDVES